jgi:hypothetical protein
MDPVIPVLGREITIADLNEEVDVPPELAARLMDEIEASIYGGTFTRSQPHFKQGSRSYVHDFGAIEGECRWKPDALPKPSK